jgi:hypothetical protein
VSISSMMDVAYRRRVDVQLGDRSLQTLDEAARAAGERPETQNPVTAALENIMTYIPGEILVTYVAVVAVIHPTAGGEAPESVVADWVAFLAFFILTPAVAWLIYAVKCLNAGKPLPTPMIQWPVWEMSAATIAYVVWAVTLPENPFSEFSWYSSGLAAIVLLIVSMLLGLMAPLFTRRPLGAERRRSSRSLSRRNDEP